MTTKKDGGPVYPIFKKSFRDCNGTAVEIREYQTTGGMSLRDFFAGMALQSYMAAYHDEHVMVIDGYQIPEVAETAYKIADAMIEEREKNNE